MKKLNFNLIIVAVILVFLFGTRALAHTTFASPDTVTFTGATPADQQISDMLGIPRDVKADFFTWELQMIPNEVENIFCLNLRYGLAQPNTTGFIGGGTEKTIRGHFTVSREGGREASAIYHLSSKQISSEIRFAEINGNLLHLLTPQRNLMTGNGGWSFTLNRNAPYAPNTLTYHHTSQGLPVKPDAVSTKVYVGRTPCQEIAKIYKWNISQDCFKLKWKLTLYFESDGLRPSTYKLERTGSRDMDLTGKWGLKGIAAHPKVWIYQLDPDQPAETIHLLVGDENVLFFLNKEYHHLVGNSEFSYTLNRAD